MTWPTWLSYTNFNSLCCIWLFGSVLIKFRCRVSFWTTSVYRLGERWNNTKEKNSIACEDEADGQIPTDYEVQVISSETDGRTPKLAILLTMTVAGTIMKTRVFLWLGTGSTKSAWWRTDSRNPGDPEIAMWRVNIIPENDHFREFWSNTPLVGLDCKLLKL